MKKLITFLYILLFVSNGYSNQRVGVVLSGGGAAGFAHIGVLKALEERQIPIDYITGTSAGALIGALYASGYSPIQIEQLASSERFYLMSQGVMEKEYEFYIHQFNETAELFSLRFAKDSIFQKSLPTNLLNPTILDLELLNLLAGNPISSKNSFDSLFIPFRCVASDIVTKKSILFKNGDLNIAVRASMTYPFFISPIYVDGKLLFDGGLYNNFPSKEMYNEFIPDYIIGSNVSYNEPPPTDDDLMSQIKNMFSSHSNFSLPCENGIIIEPELGMIGTFDFNKIKQAIDIGYQTTLEKIDSIRLFIDKKVTEKELWEKREDYKKNKRKIHITDIKTDGVSDEEDYYYKKKLIKYKKDELLDYDMLKNRYLRLYQNEYILSIFPNIDYLSDTSQVLKLQIKKEKPLKAAFGGHFSSRSVNTGFLEVSYTDFKINPITLYANTYFGKFYGSVNTGFRFYLPTKNDSYIEPIYVMNRWDYFTSFSTFFEDVKPSFLILNEMFWGVKYKIPIFNKGKLELSFKNGVNDFNYYQTKNFTNKDTADFTSLLFYSPGFSYTFNSLDKKQFETKGMFFEFKSRFIHGIERTIPGSTAINQDELDNTFRNWVYFKSTFKNYFFSKGNYHLGIFAEAHYSFVPFLNNYTVSTLISEPFEPFPDTRTFFFSDYRANQYAAIGLINVLNIRPKLDLRIEAYFFQPFQKIINDNGKAAYSSFNLVGFELASASLIYHSFIGPIRGSFNYFGNQEKPFSFQLSYGFVMFNEKSLK